MLLSRNDRQLLAYAWTYGQCPRGNPGLGARAFLKAGRGLPGEREKEKEKEKDCCEQGPE